MKRNKNKLKIAVVVKRFVTTGGAERYAVEIARRMQQKGHKVDLYSREVDEEAARGMTVFKVPKKMEFSGALSLYTFAKSSHFMFSKKEYDIVHSHDRGYGHDVSTVHTFSYKKGVENFSFLKKVNDIYCSPRARLHLWLEKKQMASPVLVAVSDIIKADIRHYHERHKDVFVVTPGVDTYKFSCMPHEGRCLKPGKERKDSKNNRLVVLFIGSEFRRKGLGDLIPSITRDMELLVVGRGEHHKFYKNLVKKNRLEENISFKGLKDNVSDYYHAADVLVLPSRREAFGMTVLEAMACGLPVITSAAVGSAALIENKKNGFVFQHPSELKQMLKKLMDKKRRELMGREARKTAEKYTWDLAANQYENVYYDCIRKKSI